MNCVIKREEEKCMEMIASDDPGNEPEFGGFGSIFDRNRLITYMMI